MMGGGQEKKFKNFFAGDGLSKNEILKLVRHSRRTREHLIRRADGGLGLQGNIVYAHAFCNSSRGERPTHIHKKYMLKRVEEETHPLSKLNVKHKT